MQTGKLKTGYWADLSVLDIDSFNLEGSDPEKILQGNIVMTVVNGKIVYLGP
ncbi:MAG: putative amidohydrolase YtcJ [Arenicella sp.]|jgi:predicted amidohydrolase YtcJ